MAPKVKHTREAIIRAGLEVVRDRGPAGLTARNIAERLGSSVQPIYRTFAAMDALSAEVGAAASRIALSYAREAEDEESAFLAIGLGYLEFSRAEPNLFHLLPAGGFRLWSPTGTDWPLFELLDKMRRDDFIAELSEEALQRLLRDMFIYTHGLSALSPAKPTRDDRSRERSLLRDVGGRLMALAVLEERGEFSFEAMTRRFHT